MWRGDSGRSRQPRRLLYLLVCTITGERERPSGRRTAAMPFVRIDALGTDSARLDALGRAVHDALVETIGFPPDDRFQVLVGHDGARSTLRYDNYFGIQRDDGLVFVAITMRSGRTPEAGSGSGVWCRASQGGGGSQGGALATDDNAARCAARPREPGMIQTTAPRRSGNGGCLVRGSPHQASRIRHQASPGIHAPGVTHHASRHAPVTPGQCRWLTGRRPPRPGRGSGGRPRRADSRSAGRRR